MSWPPRSAGMRGHSDRSLSQWTCVDDGDLVARRTDTVDPAFDDAQLAVEKDKIGAAAGGDPSQLMVKAEERSRVCARQHHRVFEIESQHGYRISNRARHVEIGAGERALRVDAFAA